MEDMGFRDPMCQSTTDPAKERAGTTQETTVESSKSSALEVERRATIMGHQWAGVLQERNQDKPMVGQEIGNACMHRYQTACTHGL